jgi:diaminopimelate epimerase
MNIAFYKYQGTGNDFVMIDNRTNTFPKSNTNIISNLCDRHFGIGADGVILIENDTEFDFKMIYFNADGSQTFCGNGGRCAVAFAKKLKMIDVEEIKVHENSVFTYTGTQHHVELVDDLDLFPVYEEGKKIRNSYKDPGSNVNFVEQINTTTFRVRTYEKGVENETLACGTGVTAVAIAMHKIKKTTSTLISLPVEGGNLEVSFTEENGVYKNVFLKGPAKAVYNGNITL